MKSESRFEAKPATTRQVFNFEHRDPQGITWNSIEFSISRELFRQRRNFSYNSFRNTSEPLSFPKTITNNDCKFFSFVRNHTFFSEFSHFQLRNNVQCKSYSELYVKRRVNTITKFNPVTSEEKQIVDNPGFPVVSFDVHNEFILLGGMEGELMLWNMETGSKSFQMLLTEDPSRITNCCKLFDDNGTMAILVGNNDRKIRVVDPETQKVKFVKECEACVNHVNLAEDKRKVGVCLDSVNDMVMDLRTGDIICTLVGHTDFGFSVDWDPMNQHFLATGNQDHSAMIWDIRQGNECRPYEVLKAELGAVLCVKYSKNGKYLAFSEAADYFSIFDKRTFKERQRLDYFGEISGFCFCEDDRDNLSIFIGMGDPTYCSLIELQEKRKKSYNF